MILPLLALLTATAPPEPPVRAIVRAEHAAVVEMRTAALIMSGQQGGGLPIAVTALPVAALPGNATTVLVEVDGAALLEGSETAPGLTIEIFAYVLGTELDVLAQTSLALDLDLARHRQLLAGTGLKVFLPLEVPPGESVLRILAKAGEAFGLRSLELPAGVAAGARRIPPPVFHETARPWLVAVPGGLEIDLPPPFGLDAGSPLPATRVATRAGGTILGQVWLTARSDPSRNLIALVRKRGGEAVEAPLAIRARTAAAGGGESVAMSFTAPEDLEPGLYELAVSTGLANAGEAAETRSDFAPFFVEAVAAPVAPAAAADKDPLAAGRKRAPTRAQRRMARVAGDAYARALRQLAAGEGRAAQATLRASEERVARELDADAVELLAQAEARVLERLPDSDWGCVLPVILLHLDLSRAYRDSGRRILTHHATEMTAALADAYAGHLDTPQAAAEAARALSSLAGYLQSAGALSQAERLFTRALELAADDAAALLGLATIFEKRGLTRKAVPVFAGFVEARPEHAEGALRLALNRARAGETAAAKEIFGRLTDRRTDWVGLLAHQELARLLMDGGMLPAAAGVLRQGLERWPDHPTLVIQLAWVLDAQGELQASSDLLETLGSNAVALPADERSRYNRWPEDVLLASRRSLAQTAGERLDDLERWLSSQDVAGGS